MDSYFHWFTKFFTYSSIQVKIIASVLAVFVYFIGRKIILKFVMKSTDDPKIRYNWQKTTGYIGAIIVMIIIGRIWFKGIQSLATYLGLLSAGIAIALKDPLTNITGWLFILWRSPLEVGDRIQVGKHAGDVIDVNIFKFTIMEIGNWVNADQNTGRIIHIPNGKVFTETLANYGKGFKYIWNEIPVLITFESNWEKAKDILSEISKKHAEHLSKAASKRLKLTTKKFLIHQPNFAPTVYTKVEDSGVLLTIRYLCNPRKRRDSEQDIWEEVLKQFSNQKEIDFAYPTTRFYKEEM
ncbi:MAG: mechanosensitive ion channel family protein [Candidatus Marinimicrobia bacterium]|nr:mechanosensitive ion channel family protein [Candidatus Neomarinimicrobiota bacterium]MBL7022599.1 mechanosensitive ion channel family protein [Candidatus Neomarinimicrobiota bacterium]MBL7109866.1 mechanosensitive ion channel family protein [Candidatus Neomarinimicrobiota bacterium]